MGRERQVYMACPTVQVLFGDTGSTGVLGQTAAEHVGQTAALALVHKDEQGQHEAEQHDDDLQRDLKSGHRVPPD